jgi:hypothetical protein
MTPTSPPKPCYGDPLPDAATKPAKVDLLRATECTPEVSDAIDAMFTYQPWDESQQRQGSLVRTFLANAVKAIIDTVPPCHDRSAAIRKLREARMDCNSAITTRGQY